MFFKITGLACGMQFLSNNIVKIDAVMHNIVIHAIHAAFALSSSHSIKNTFVMHLIGLKIQYIIFVVISIKM